MSWLERNKNLCQILSYILNEVEFCQVGFVLWGFVCRVFPLGFSPYTVYGTITER